ncbi:MAG: DNA polymerase III subunit delta [Oscillospiraceae bacterium]
MTINSEGDLNSHLKEIALKPVYLFYSPDAKLKNLWCDRLAKQIAGEKFPEFNLQEFEGDRLDVERLADAVEAMPYQSEKKAVVIKNLDYTALDKIQSEALHRIIADIPEDTVLLISGSAEFGNSVAAKTKEKEYKLIKAVDKVGCVAALGERGINDKRRMLINRSGKRNCTIHDKAINYILQNCPNDMATLENEIDKLTAYQVKGEISLETAQLLCSTAMDAVVFDLAKRILAGNVTAAMAVLDELLYQKNKPTVILIQLSKAYMDLYRAKLGAAAGKSSKEIMKDFGYPSNVSFRVNNAISDSKRYTLPQLRNCMNLLAQTDYQLKSSKVDDIILMQKLIVELMIK